MEEKRFAELKNTDIFQYQFIDSDKPFIGMKVGTMAACDLTNGKIAHIRGSSVVKYLPKAKIIF